MDQKRIDDYDKMSHPSVEASILRELIGKRLISLTRHVEVKNGEFFGAAKRDPDPLRSTIWRG